MSEKTRNEIRRKPKTNFVTLEGQVEVNETFSAGFVNNSRNLNKQFLR